MKDDIERIILHYGVKHQLEYFQGEIWELNDAITRYLCEEYLYYKPVEDSHKHCICGELADCFVMLKQFILYFDIDDSYFDNAMTPVISNMDLFLKNDLGKSVYKMTCGIRDIEICENVNLARLIQDVYHNLKCIQNHLKISDKDVKEIMYFKVDRQLTRMEKEKA